MKDEIYPRERGGSNLYLYRVSCDATNVTGSAMVIGACSRVYQRGAMGSFVGASAGGDKAYVFSADTSVKSDTWLAANFASDTDVKGAYLTRQD